MAKKFKNEDRVALKQSRKLAEKARQQARRSGAMAKSFGFNAEFAGAYLSAEAEDKAYRRKQKKSFRLHCDDED